MIASLCGQRALLWLDRPACGIEDFPTPSCMVHGPTVVKFTTDAPHLSSACPHSCACSQYQVDPKKDVLGDDRHLALLSKVRQMASASFLPYTVHLSMYPCANLAFALCLCAGGQGTPAAAE